MEINKYNQSIVGIGDLSFHDLLIRSIDFDVKKRELCIIISDYHKDKFSVKFEYVFDLCFTHRYADIISQTDAIIDWEEIPNEITRDYYIDEVKNTFISNGGEWNEELFAISFLLSDISKIKVICERIYVEQIPDGHAYPIL